MSDVKSESAKQYMQETVGAALTDAFTALTLAQPADGIEFLTQYLNQYAVSEKFRAERQAEADERDRLRVELNKEQARKDAIQAEKQKKQDTIEENYKSLMDKLNGLKEKAEAREGVKWGEDLWTEIASNCRAVLGAEDGYVGRLVEEATQYTLEEPEVQYTDYSTNKTGALTMVNRVLKKSQGVSHAVFEEVPPPEDEEEAATHRKYQHKMIPHVTDEESVHYFEWIKLGAYVAVPLVHKTYLTQEAFASFVEYEKTPAPELPEDAEEGTPPPEKPAPEPPSKEIKYLIGVDTLGTNLGFEKFDEKMVKILELLDTAGKAREAVEFQDVWKQSTLFVAEHPLTAKFEELKAKEPSTTADAKMDAWKEANPEKIPTETLSSLHEAERAYEVALEALTELGDERFDTLLDLVVVNDNILDAMQVAMYLAGFKRADFEKGPHKEIRWEVMKKSIPKLFEKIQTLKLSEIRKDLTPEQRFNNLTALKPADLGGEALELGSFSFAVVWYWLDAALNLRQKYLEDKKKEYDLADEAYKNSVTALKEWADKEAEGANAGEDGGEGGGEKPELLPKPTPLDEVDDDFIENE